MVTKSGKERSLHVPSLMVRIPVIIHCHLIFVCEGKRKENSKCIAIMLLKTMNNLKTERKQ